MKAVVDVGRVVVTFDVGLAVSLWLSPALVNLVVSFKSNTPPTLVMVFFPATVRLYIPSPTLQQIPSPYQSRIVIV